MVEIVSATSPEDIERIRVLFRSYAASLDFSLCFQGFEEELASLPGSYAPPQGDLLLMLADGRPAGCVAFRPLADEICEMKRLYVDPAYRGRGLGRLAAEEAIERARRLGYRTMLLDTIGPRMAPAVALYGSLGFEFIEDYNSNPVPGATHMRLQLA